MTEKYTSEITGHHRWPLLGALGVVVFTIGVVGASVLLDKKPVNVANMSDATTVMARELFFRDAANGNVNVYDAITKKRIGSFGKGEGAFVRISMRSMAHSRKQKEIDPRLPYRLVKLSDGNMRIVDPQSGDSIRLNAFGQVAIKSFAKFLIDQTGKGAQG